MGDHFVGRGEEMRQLERSARSLAKGAASAVLLRGPSGIGKSALAVQFLSRQRSQDAVVWATRCYESEAVPHNAASELIGQIAATLCELPDDAVRAVVPDDAGALARLFPPLGRVAAIGAAGAEADGHDLQSRGFGALRQLLRRLAESRRVAVFVDDVQWLDPDTARLLGDVLRPPGAPPVLLLLGARDVPAGQLPLERLVTSYGERARVVELGPLSRADATDLARRLLGKSVGDLPAQIAREAAGHPFFVAELADYVRTADRGASLAVALEDVLRLRIDPLEAPQRELLDLACVAAEPIAASLLAVATARDDVTAELDALRDAHLIRTSSAGGERVVEPFHDRVREWVVRALNPELRRRRHRQLAHAFDRSGEGSPVQLARHYFASGAHDRAAHFALRAAARAHDTLNFEQAIELYQMALRIGSYTDERERDIELRLAEAFAGAGRPLDAAREFRSAADDAEPAERLELTRRAAEELLCGGYIAEGLDAIDAVLDEVGMRRALGNAGALASYLARRGWLRVRGLRWRRRDAADIPAAELTRIDASWSVAKGLTIVDTVHGADFLTRNLLRALRLGEPRRIARALALDAALFAARGAGDRARARVDAVEETLADVDDPYGAAMAVWARGAIDYFVENRWRDSLEKLERAEAMLRAMAGTGWEIDTLRLYVCLNLMWLGDLPALDRRARRFIADCERRGDRFGAVSLRTRIPIVWLMRDDPHAARSEVDGGLEAWAPGKRRYQVQNWFALYGRCEVELYRGEPRRAAELVAADLPRLHKAHLLRVPMVQAEFAYMRARIALALGDARVAGRLARRLERCDPPVAGAYAALIRAGAALAVGDRDAARAALERARDGFGELGAGLYEAVADWAWGELVGGTEGEAASARARAYLKRQRVQAPERLAEMILPTGDG